MITFFSAPKPFTDHIDIIQRNAIKSWLLQPKCEIILFGDEKGTPEIAKEIGAINIKNNSLNQYGTPFINDLFYIAENIANNDILCYVNCDIIFTNNLSKIINLAFRKFPKFLLIGQCINLRISELVQFNSSRWNSTLQKEIQSKGEARGYYGIDYFFFPKQSYRNIPPFSLGRAYFDNWLIWKARSMRLPVIDASKSITAVHQNHDYKHVIGGREEAYFGNEAQKNLMLAGGTKHIYAIFDANYRIIDHQIKRNISGFFRIYYHYLKLKKKYRKLPGVVRKFLFPLAKPLGIRRKNISRIINWIGRKI